MSRVVPDLVATMSGHSGCQVLLYREGDGHFVRKISASPAYNHRLDRQCEKQRCLSALIATPAILNQGKLGDLSYFDMEYVRGYDVKTYLALQNVTSLSDLSRRILAPLTCLSSTCSGFLDEREFQTKVGTVCSDARLNPSFPAHASVLEPIFDHLAVADWSRIPLSHCHGDYTLENLVIADDDDVVAIDMLDGPLESYWLDAAKLLHDLDSGWSFRAVLWKVELSSSDRLISMLVRYLHDEISMKVRLAFPDLQDRLWQLSALQATRVLPYVTSEHVFWNVVRGLDRLFQKGL